MILTVESRNSGGKNLPCVDLGDSESTWDGQESNKGHCT